MRRPYWVRWWDDPEVNFVINSPWWGTDARPLKLDDNFGGMQYEISAAVMATSREDAIQQIVEAYDDCNPDIEWTSIEEQPLGWSPFSEKRQRKHWMVWTQKPH